MIYIFQTAVSLNWTMELEIPPVTQVSPSCSLSQLSNAITLIPWLNAKQLLAYVSPSHPHTGLKILVHLKFKGVHTPESDSRSWVLEHASSSNLQKCPWGQWEVDAQDCSAWVDEVRRLWREDVAAVVVESRIMTCRSAKNWLDLKDHMIYDFSVLLQSNFDAIKMELLIIYWWSESAARVVLRSLETIKTTSRSAIEGASSFWFLHDTRLRLYVFIGIKLRIEWCYLSILSSKSPNAHAFHCWSCYPDRIK